MQTIVDVHYPGLQQQLVSQALEVFFAIRELPGLKKTHHVRTAGLAETAGQRRHRQRQLAAHANASLPPLAGALLKNEQDLSLFERLSNMARLRRG
jgi:hypothetical protein